jgi:hypothetical protein
MVCSTTLTVAQAAWFECYDDGMFWDTTPCMVPWWWRTYLVPLKRFHVCRTAHRQVHLRTAERVIRLLNCEGHETKRLWPNLRRCPCIPGGNEESQEQYQGNRCPCHIRTSPPSKTGHKRYFLRRFILLLATYESQTCSIMFTRSTGLDSKEDEPHANIIPSVSLHWRLGLWSVHLVLWIRFPQWTCFPSSE